MEDAKELVPHRNPLEELLEASLEAILRRRVRVQSAKSQEQARWFFLTLLPKNKLHEEPSAFAAVRFSIKSSGDGCRLFLTQYLQLGKLPEKFWDTFHVELRKILNSNDENRNLFEIKFAKEMKEKFFGELKDVEIPIEILEYRTQAKKTKKWDEAVFNEDAKELAQQFEKYRREGLHVPILRRMACLPLTEFATLDADDIREALDKESDHLSFQFILARLTMEHEGYEELAIENLSDALKSLASDLEDSEAIESLRNVPLEFIGDAWVSENEDRARVCYEEVLRHRNYDERLINKILVLVRNAHDHEAELSLLKKKLSVHKSKDAKQDLNQEIALVYLNHFKDPEKAYDAIECALNIDTQNVESCHIMARVLSNMGRPRDAADFLFEKIDELKTNGNQAVDMLRELLENIVQTQINRPDLLQRSQSQAESSVSLEVESQTDLPVEEEELSQETQEPAQHVESEFDIESSIRDLETRADLAEGIFTRTISTLLLRGDEERIKEYLRQLCGGEIQVERLAYYFEIYFDLCQQSENDCYGLIDFGIQRLFDLGLDLSNLHLKAIQLLKPSNRPELLLPYVSGMISLKQIPPLSDEEIERVLEGHDFTLGLFYELKAQVNESSEDGARYATRAIEKFQETQGAEKTIRKLEETYKLNRFAPAPVAELPPPPPLVPISVLPTIPVEEVPVAKEPIAEVADAISIPMDLSRIEMPRMDVVTLPKIEKIEQPLEEIQSQPIEENAAESYTPSWAQAETPKAESSIANPPKEDPQPIELPNIEVPVVELPKIEIASIEPLKVEMPPMEVSNTESPQVEAPAIDLSQEQPQELGAILEKPLALKIEFPAQGEDKQNALSDSDILSIPGIKIVREQDLGVVAPNTAQNDQENAPIETRSEEQAKLELSAEVEKPIQIKLQSVEATPVEVKTPEPEVAKELVEDKASDDFDQPVLTLNVKLVGKNHEEKKEEPEVKAEAEAPKEEAVPPPPPPLAAPANEFGPAATYTEEKTEVLSVPDAGVQSAGEPTPAAEPAKEGSVASFDPSQSYQTISELDWRSAIKLKELPANAAQIVSNQAFVSEIEKHIALQLMSLATGDFKPLEKWHMRVWRHNREWLYPIQGRDRFPAGTSSKLLESNLAHVLTLCEKVMIGAFIDRFSIEALSRKLHTPKHALMRMMRPIPFEDPWVQGSSLGLIVNRIQNAKFSLVSLPGLSKDVFFDLDKRLIIFDKDYFTQSTVTILFHRILVGLWQLKLGYFATINLDPVTDVTPFLNEVMDYFAKDFVKKIKARAGFSALGANKFIHLVPQEALKEYLRGIGEINSENVMNLASAMEVQAMKMDLAETLDLIGIFEARLGHDLINGQKLKLGKIFTLPLWSSELLKFATKLKV